MRVLHVFLLALGATLLYLRGCGTSFLHSGAGAFPRAAAPARYTLHAARAEMNGMGAGDCAGVDASRLQSAFLSLEFYGELVRSDTDDAPPWLLSPKDTAGIIRCNEDFGWERWRIRFNDIVEQLKQKYPGEALLEEVPADPQIHMLDTDFTTKACCSRILSRSHRLPDGDNVSAVAFVIDVDAPVEGVAERLDPQTWTEPEGSSAFREISYLGPSCPQDPDADGTAFPPGAGIGEGWAAVVREHFSFGCEGNNASCTEFRNNLIFDSELANGDFELHYTLCEDGSRKAVANGHVKEPGGLLADCGFTSAGHEPGGMTRVKGAKRLEFDSQLCTAGDCSNDEEALYFAQVVLVEATAIAVCNAPGAMPGSCSGDVEGDDLSRWAESNMCAHDFDVD